MARLNVLRCSVAVVGLAVAAAAFGAEPATTLVTNPTTPGVTASDGATDGVICKKRLRAGSHIAKRICMTPAQWTAFLTARRHSRGLPTSVHGGAGPSGNPAGNVHTAGASVGMSAFTAR